MAPDFLFKYEIEKMFRKDTQLKRVMAISFNKWTGCFGSSLQLWIGFKMFRGQINRPIFT